MNGDVRFFDYLRDRIGLDVASVGAPMIERAVQQRRSAAGQASLEHYWQLLQGSASEQQALIEAVIVPETWFLRYPETFVALAQMARQRLAGLSGLRPLRLLSLPCSTGEEPYSIAISLLDAGLAPRQFSIDAVDISPLSVEKARRALYGRNSFRGQNLSFRERHFTTTPQGEQLHQAVMAQVRFHTGNILDPLLLAGELPYDFVFCRNLLIYFDLPTQQRVFEVLKGFTQADGALFIGPAEGSLLARMGMRPLGIAQSFAFVRQAEPGPPPVVASAMTLRRPMASRPPIEPRPRRAPAAQPTLRPASAAQPAAAAGTAAAALAQISALANEGKSAEARQLCEDYLRQHPPQAQVYYWLGLLSDLEGDAGQAQAHYRKALYLQPQHAAALAHLAMLLAAQGDSAGARRLQERAARAADQEPG